MKTKPADLCFKVGWFLFFNKKQLTDKKSYNKAVSLVCNVGGIIYETKIFQMACVDGKNGGTSTKGLEYTFIEAENAYAVTGIRIPTKHDGLLVVEIGDDAFEGCRSLTSVYYKGTASDWETFAENISISNYYLTNATRYYYVENEENVPTDGGRYWHYVDGVPTAW